MDLSPGLADEKIFEGDGGSYYSWSSSKFPLLREAKVGAGRLLLRPCGFALPHYADSAKIGYVVQGSCTVGLVFPNEPEEKVLKIKKGDAIPVPIGVVSWWFNGGDSDLVAIFIGETSKSHIPGKINYFVLTGMLGVLRGFSTEFISRAHNINEDEANKLVTSQTGALIIKLDEGTQIPQPRDDTGNEMILDIENVIRFGSTLTTATEFPFLEQVGLSARLVKLDGNAVCPPIYAADSSVQVIYIVKGSGVVQSVDMNGQRVLEARVKAGDLFVVPRFFVAMEVADGEGMEYFSIITSSQPVFGQLGGSTSVWKALSPVVVQTSMGITPELAEVLTHPRL